MVLRLDDFTTGTTSFSVPAPTKNGEQVVETHFQEGSMLGGTRLTRVYNALSPQGKPVHLDVSGGRLDLKLDRDQYARLEIGYGFPADGSSGALGLNLHAGGADRLRITIPHLDLSVVNFNVVIFTPAGWSAVGQNVDAGEIDFRFADFTGPGGQDFSNINLIVLVFQLSGTMRVDGIETRARGSLLGDATAGAWLPQFGRFEFPAPDTVVVTAGSPVNGQLHAEAHHAGVLGGDFVYSATITADWTIPGLSTDLQFRMSDEGRYGVRLREGRISFYRFMLDGRVCDERHPGALAPCPSWPHMDGGKPVDFPVEYPLGSAVFDTALRTIGVTIVAEGPRFIVAFDAGPIALGRFEVSDTNLGVGRFGVYVLTPRAGFPVRFSALTVTTDPTALSNFTLLYSVPGYEARGTKRALVRTLNDMDAREYDEARSSITIRNLAGDAVISDRPFETAGPFGPASRLPRTQGHQFLAADFTDLGEAGTYTIEARVATTRGVRELRSLPFEIRPGLVSETLLRPLGILNAEMRNAGEEDFRRNWRSEAGAAAWSVGVDGAFIAHHADDQAGAVLRRTRDMSNNDLTRPDFRFVATITIVDGCDAQLQFRIRPEERWGVTLQAGAAGGCRHGGGPGAVRLHREGPAVPGNFHAVASRLFDPPFEAGRPYDVEVRATAQKIVVLVDNEQMLDFTASEPARPGGFALKAWGSTARFSHAKIWSRHVPLSYREHGSWIPFNPGTRLSSQGFPIALHDSDTILGPVSDGEIARPLAAMQHGFNDCNNVIGEITSHGVFLSALMDVWATRAHAHSPQDQERLRRAIVTAVLYLHELREEADRTGAYAHQEPGRAALSNDVNKLLTSEFAMYGLSSFAEKGASVDRALARTALKYAKEAWDWYHGNGGGGNPIPTSIAAIRIARAARREGEPSEIWFDRAHKAARAVLDIFGQPGAMANSVRDTVRTIPWFEGVYETFFRGSFALTDRQRAQVTQIAADLVGLANNRANGFCIMPQAHDERRPPVSSLPLRNWNNLADLPLAAAPIPRLPDPSVGDWYVTTHFATAAADCVYIGRLAGERALERLATGNLYWPCGLNPGIPSTKLATNTPPPAPWSVASFVYKGPGLFARTIEGHRTSESASKATLAPWEERSGSRHRETWWLDPLNNGYASITNGHVLREGQWHYWSIGVDGWVCGETFMLTDASFLRAALALEDWHADTTVIRSSPYDVSKLHFFDTTHLDRAGSGWLFDDPDRTSAAHASRMATELAAGKGFGGARLTGHHIGERVGLLCLPIPGTTFVDIVDREIDATPFPFGDINTAPWAQVGRAAAAIAAARGFGAGFFTGHQNPGMHGWIGIDASLVEVFDIDDGTVAASPWAFDDINVVPWARAARLATDVCVARGFAGGFFTGHQLPGRRQIAALRFT